MGRVRRLWNRSSRRVTEREKAEVRERERERKLCLYWKKKTGDGGSETTKRTGKV